ncbi:MAG: type IV pilus biogenesis/stability protein PilW [Pseudomonadota bacterium]
MMHTFWLGLVVALTVLVTSCAQPMNAPDGGPAASPGRDRITESDETPDTRRARVRLELASAYFGRGQLTTALDEVKLAIASDPNLVGAFNLRGLIYAGLGDDGLAEESFRRALQIDARDADSLQNYGWYLCQRRRFEESDALFNRALAVPLYRNAQRTLVTKGSCQAREGRLEQAEATLNRAYEIDPTNPLAAVNLAEVLYRRAEFERARFFIRRINANPDMANSQTLWLGARVENRLGNTAGTQALGKQLRDRFPKSPEAMAFERGRFDE